MFTFAATAARIRITSYNVCYTKLLRNLGEKHGLRDDAGAVKAYDATASGRSRRWIVFTPRKTVSWNNERL